MRQTWTTLLPETTLLCNAMSLRLLARAQWRPYSRSRIRKDRPASLHGIFTTAALGDVVAVERLLAAGADVNHPWEGFTPLMAASLEGHSMVVRRLLEGRAHPNARHPTGMTALLCAIRSRNYLCVQLLLGHGANPRRLRRGDLAPLDLARLMGQDLMADLIRATFIHL